MPLARNADDIELAYQDDTSPSPVILAELEPQNIVERHWPCITLIGPASGVHFVDSDLRGADLSHLAGAEFTRCWLFGASLAADSRTSECEKATLTTN